MEAWSPITAQELTALLSKQLEACPSSSRAFFELYRVEPYKVPIHRLGNIEQVYVVAQLPSGVIYYEDVEGGFEFDAIASDGAIPKQGCNQFELKHVLSQLGSNK